MVYVNAQTRKYLYMYGWENHLHAGGPLAARPPPEVAQPEGNRGWLLAHCTRRRTKVLYLYNAILLDRPFPVNFGTYTPVTARDRGRRRRLS